jgi:membrane associated rhomboid family serine protease
MNSPNTTYKRLGWFQGAPLAKLACFKTIGFFVILKNNQDLIALDLEDLVEHREFYRLFLYSLSFQTFGEMLMGLAVLVPLFKRFEREFGTVKIAVFLCKSLFLATFFQCFFLSDRYLATGPYPVIGALLYLYHKFTPRLYPNFVSVLGFNFSEKALTHLFALQLIFHHGYQSLIPFLAGYISGVLSISEKTPYGRWEPSIPQPIYNVVHNMAKATGLEDLSHAPSYISHQRSTRTRGSGTGTGAAMQRNVNNNAGAPPPAVPPPVVPQFEPMPAAQPPSPENIEQLTAMGFERDVVVMALREADNNVEHAANRLLSGS